MVISSSGRRSHTGPDVPGQAVIRVYMCPGELPRALVGLPAHGGLPWCGWSGVPWVSDEEMTAKDLSHPRGRRGLAHLRGGPGFGAEPQGLPPFACSAFPPYTCSWPPSVSARQSHGLRLEGCWSWVRRSLG